MLADHVAGLCAPGACDTVFMDACDTKTFGPLFAACARLWELRGSVVTRERQLLTRKLHKLVLTRCQLTLWTEDAQLLAFNLDTAPIFELDDLLALLEVPLAMHKFAVTQLIEAGEVFQLPRRSDNEPVRVVAWPQFVYAITGLFVHHDQLPEAPPPLKSVPHSQRRDAALMHLISAFRSSVPSDQKASFAAGMVDTAWLKYMMTPEGDAERRAAQLCELAVDLGICFHEDGSRYRFPPLLPDGADVSRLWPQQLSESAIVLGMHLRARLSLRDGQAAAAAFPPGLFHRFLTLACRDRRPPDVVVWKTGVVLTGAGLAINALPGAARADLERCFVRIEQASNHVIAIYVVAQPQGGHRQHSTAGLPGALHAVAQLCIEWLHTARLDAKFTGLDWEVSFVRNEAGALWRQLAQCHTSDAVDWHGLLATAPALQVEAEVRQGLDRSDTAPHFHLPSSIDALELRQVRSGRSSLEVRFAVLNALGGRVVCWPEAQAGEPFFAVTLVPLLGTTTAASMPLTAVASPLTSSSHELIYTAALPDALVVCRRWAVRIVSSGCGLIQHEQQVTTASLLPPVAEDYKCERHDACAHDVFISYRVSSERAVAGQLADALEAARPGMSVFLDSRCLAVGKGWQGGFCNCLRRSRVIVLLVSGDGMQRSRTAHQQPDNMLLEFEHALVCSGERGATVIPVLLGNAGAGKFDYHCLNAATYPSEMHAHEWSAMPVAAVVEQVAALQGLKAYDRELTADHIDTILKKVDACYAPHVIDAVQVMPCKRDGQLCLEVRFGVQPVEEFLRVTLTADDESDTAIVAVLRPGLQRQPLVHDTGPLPRALVARRRWTVRIESTGCHTLQHEERVLVSSLLPPVDDAYCCRKHGRCAHDVFISYRVNTERALASQVAFMLETARPGLSVFLDSRCLAVAEDWQGGFVNCLRRSRVIVLLVSGAGMARSRAANTEPDNMLLEFEHALACRSDHGARVVPLLLGNEGAGRFDYACLDPKTYPTDLHAHAWSTLPVATVIQQVGALQGLKAYDRTITQQHIDDILHQLDRAT